MSGNEATGQPAQAFGIIDPDYARVFTQARIVAWQYGYACLAHGTFTRDLDLLLVPWAEHASREIESIVRHLAGVTGLKLQDSPSDKPHSRKSWTLLFPAFEDVRWVDVSAFAPPLLDAAPAAPAMTDAQMEAVTLSNDAADERAHAAYLRGIDEGKRQCAAPQQVEPVAWLYEDTLPPEYPYNMMYPHSRVDGVRMFPVFGPPAAEVQRLVEAAQAVVNDSTRAGRNCLVGEDLISALRAALGAKRVMP